MTLPLLDIRNPSRAVCNNQQDTSHSENTNQKETNHRKNLTYVQVSVVQHGGDNGLVELLELLIDGSYPRHGCYYRINGVGSQSTTVSCCLHFCFPHTVVMDRSEKWRESSSSAETASNRVRRHLSAARAVCLHPADNFVVK